MCGRSRYDEPVMTAILEKDALASQPTLSRFFNRMDADTLEQFNQILCGWGKMENFIKQEGKSCFNFSAVSSSSMTVNANRLQAHVLAYNLFNWFWRLALAANMRKLRIDTIRLKLLKAAARVVRSARYKYFKLCSSCPYKEEFYETPANIRNLTPHLI